MKTNVIVLFDRDGTLIYDDKYFLGKEDNWKEQLQILPGVVQGIKELNTQNIPVYMITNQPGIIIKEFPKLTFDRADEVCKEVILEIEKKGAHIKEYFLCAHATPEYAESRKQYAFEEGALCHCECIKPNLGMVFTALAHEGYTSENTLVIMVGDRASDVKTAVNINGIGILIPFEKQPGEIDKTKNLDGEIYIEHSFLSAIAKIKELVAQKVYKSQA